MSGIKALCDNLLDQAKDKERLANGEPDSIFMQDAKVLREAAELLKAAPEWISVTDKLPEDNGHYLCALTFGLVVIDTWYAGEWVNGGNVTHWMPLPKLPKEESAL